MRAQQARPPSSARAQHRPAANHGQQPRLCRQRVVASGNDDAFRDAGMRRGRRMVGASGLERCGDDEERSGGRICDTETTAAKGKRRTQCLCRVVGWYGPLEPACLMTPVELQLDLQRTAQTRRLQSEVVGATVIWGDFFYNSDLGWLNILIILSADSRQDSDRSVI